ncbi:MAG: hypothetical protein GAK29_03576 [Acinetobacter bereziniae]|uniref:Uncharacterized protein n=1 Tax=Acinetobacter bereziniae TaxID=106648 RepID=A0A833PDL8_ACIBZ|nr:MAG: hypothetical protein GAK29_03576 [Acinetobacter bereziniae]
MMILTRKNYAKKFTDVSATNTATEEAVSWSAKKCLNYY